METLSVTQRRQLRIVLVPYPFQGHITPMLQLASVLHSKGFSITIAHANFNSPNPLNHPEFSFLSLPDNLEGYDTSFYNILNATKVMNSNCKDPFQEHLIRMKEEDGKIACIIYDAIMEFVDAVANELNIPTMVLRTTMAAYMHSHMIMFELLQQKILPLSDQSLLQEPVPKLHPLRFKDLPLSPTEEIPEPVVEFLHSFINTRSSSAVIWNTIQTLDQSPLHELHSHSQIPFFTIAPLHKMAPPSSTSLIKEDHACLSWLDKQARNSVLYVSSGSMAVLDETEQVQVLWGLIKSEHSFLWALRSDEAIRALPEGFEETIGSRGFIVKWAPQRKVLEHSAVGGFLTHCGWNSTLESLSEGVPVICRPCFADQMVNARYLTHVWGVGIELEDIDDGVERAVRRLMGSEEGEGMRRRAFEMKGELERCVESGGRSDESLNELIQFITRLSETE